MRRPFWLYLPSRHVVLERVHCQAEDVVVVAEVEALGVLLSAVDHGHGCYVVHHLPRLRVEQVVPAVVAPVPAGKHALAPSYSTHRSICISVST